MRRLHVVIAALCLLAAPSAARAQRPDGTAVLHGTALDSASGRGVRRGSVCATLRADRMNAWMLCDLVDSSGAFRIDSLAPGRWHVRLTCGQLHAFAKGLAEDSITMENGATIRRDWTVSDAGCDPRSLRRVTGTFRGYWTPGFESSEFRPCAEDAWFLPGDSLRREPFDERRAWARLRDGSLPERFEWPRAPKDRYGNPTYFVRWRGTVVGPWRYGHMGVSPFEIEVDSVLAIRAPRTGDCRPVR